MKKKIAYTLLFFILFGTTLSAQDSISVYLYFRCSDYPIVTIMKDRYETEFTRVSDDFFNTPMKPNYKSKDGRYYILFFRLPKEYNKFLYKVEDEFYSGAYIGCFSTEQDVYALCRSVLSYKEYIDKTGRDTLDDSMITYRKANNYKTDGRNRKANKLYRQAAECGNVLAMMQLAKSYRNGTGCIRSRNKARHWYELAAGWGSEYADYLVRSGEYKDKEAISIMWSR